MNYLQIKASAPQISTWVSASAGTGKTKILIDRVLRLLLSGVAFDKILCLTFTNAAASEMKERISTSLSIWSESNDIELKNILCQTVGYNVSISEIQRARKLYKSYLFSDENIKIQTIHSFCQSLLKKFPLEAGISPGVKIIDEIKTYSILQRIKRNLLIKPELQLINNYLISNLHETKINEIISDIIQNKTKFDKNIQNIYEQSAQVINKLNKVNDLAYQNILENSVIQNIIGINISSDQLKGFFLNKNGTKKKRIVPQKIAKKGSNLYDDLEKIQEQIYLIDQEQRAAYLENYSKLLSLLGSNITISYETYKFQNGLLDYNDLIIIAKNLLHSVESKEWVLYKLDGGIEHLLVDEAQDTSMDQWKIVGSIIEEFYAGDSNQAIRNRTLFVVGDEKQSIFSFQGADVNSFIQMNKSLKQKMIAGGKQFEDINLELSYRSASAILEIVYQVFNQIKNKNPELFTTQITKLSPFRTEYTGSVELWPLSISEHHNDIAWSIKTNKDNQDDGKIRLAQKIAIFIKKELKSKRMVAATGKKIKPNDFMILFRKRDELTYNVIDALKDHNIEVSGLDRISLKDNLSILDLISVAKFVLNMKDDLNLAALLKSPLINITEEELYDIAISREEKSIWEYLQSDDKYNLLEQLNIFINLFNHLHVGNFFHYIADNLGYRNKLNRDSAPDSNDAINEFLYICSNFAKEESTSIQSFLFWLEEYNNSIKRDNDSSDKVRIMTMHSAKGLQAPFVILCDTNSTPTDSGGFLFDKDGTALSAKNSNYIPNYYKELKMQRNKESCAEYLRLLYVGMTRAEDHLIICGHQGKKLLPDNCWYNLVLQTLTKIAEEQEDGTLIYGKADRYETKDCSDPSTNIQFKLFTPNYFIDNFRIKSNNLNNSRPASSLLLRSDPMHYGLVFHKILEDAINSNNLKLMNSHPLIYSLSEKLQIRIQNSIEQILVNKELIKMINTKDTKTELSVGCKINDQISIGRVDLLLIDQSEIIIIDYKSDEKPILDKANISQNYYKQLLTYSQMIKQIYPTHIIRTMILWLENGRLQEI